MRCGYIPPFVLGNMAKSGIEDARISILQDLQSRDKRNKSNKNVDMEIFAGAAASGGLNGDREIYDSQNTWKQQVQIERTEGDPDSSDGSVNNVYEALGVVRKYFKDVMGRNSIDNLGMKLTANVHFGVKYMNAFWDGDEMTFGDGDGKILVNFDKSLDVIAHELTHGITQYTANLVYQGQSGALNEHFSDVFGTAITQYQANQTAEDADWLIGDEIMGPDLYGEALRSMMEPGTAYDNKILGKDPQPNHMDNYYTGSGDNYGVHINSGIPNKAFYLVSMDIGTDTAAQIWYHALQSLYPTANFNQAVAVIVNSARILVKAGKVPKGSPQSVRTAFKAVGLPK